MISNVKAGQLVANQALMTESGRVAKDSKPEKSEKVEKTEKSAELSRVDSLKEMISNGTYVVNVPAVAQKMADTLLEGNTNV